MRVAIFTDNDFDRVNGVTTTLTALLEHAPADIAPRVYTASALATEAPDYLALRSIPLSIPFYAGVKIQVPRWREYLRRVHADRIDLLHLTTTGPMGLAALWIASRTGLPLVGSLHLDLAGCTSIPGGPDRLGGLMRRYVQWVYGHCRQVMVPSTASAAWLRETGICSERVTLWTRGVDASVFSPQRRSPQLRVQWRVSERRPALLYVGRVSAERGVALIPDVLRHLHGLGVPHRLIVVGDGPLRPWLAEQCPEAVFAGMLGRERLAEAFASADVFLFPSVTDTAGNVVLEAQASGLPVIASASGACEDVVAGLTGVVCSGADPAQWARTAADLCNDFAARSEMAAAARRYALTRGWETALDSVYQTYRNAIAPAPRTVARTHAA